jgi:hypothetical protein
MGACWKGLEQVEAVKARGNRKDRATMAGLAPASVCSTLRFVHFSAPTSLFSQRVKDSATKAGLAPASVCSTLRFAHSAHPPLYSRSASKTAPRWNSSCARAYLRCHHKREQNGRCQPPARCVDRERDARATSGAWQFSPNFHPPASASKRNE